MNTLPCEIVDEIYKYLYPKNQIIFSSCSKKSHSSNIRDYALLRFKSVKLILPYVVVHNKNPIFGNNEDLDNFIEEILILSNPNKQLMILNHLSYYVDKMFNYSGKYNNNMNKYIIYKKKHAYSPYKWDTIHDKSILQWNVLVSSIYNVKLFSREYNIIVSSLSLKALIG